MACTPQANMLTANSCKFSSSPTNNLFLFNRYQKDSNKRKCSLKFFRIRASSDDETDCNVEECAPDKEVGKVSMEWLAGEKTKVLGTFPPRNRGWTGYVEKDTAGQTNIYSVEPTVYVAESAISSGTAGSSADGSENTLAAVAGVALATIAAASLILLQVDKKSPPQIQTVEYSGPSLSYYINKFKPSEMVGPSVPTEPETMISVQSESPKGTVPDVFSIQVESAYQVEDVLS